MSCEVVAKLRVKSSSQLPDNPMPVLDCATSSINPHFVEFVWNDNDWSGLGWEEVSELDEWLDGLEEDSYQFVCLVKDDRYLEVRGSNVMGIRVRFEEE